MRNKRVWSLLLALTLAAGLLTGCGAAPETAEQDDRPALVVGVDPFPPYAYIGAAGAPVGIDIELATEAFGRMGYRAEFRFIDWSAKAELLENGEIDCLWCCFSMDGRTEGDTAWFEFICADTGIGMSESFQKHLFEPFAQEHSTARSTYGGTGLGMPIAKALVDRMGGSITFTSKVGEGTTFRITLPFRMDESAALPRQETAPDMAGALRGMRVLLAEDNDLNMEIAEFMLQSAGAEVTEARDGREAVELFRALPTGYFDAVLMDVMMPVLDGYQATGIIRASERPDAGVPVIAMTANAFVEDRQRAREAGMTEHLPKPLDQAVLVQTLQRWKKE